MYNNLTMLIYRIKIKNDRKFFAVEINTSFFFIRFFERYLRKIFETYLNI